MRTQPVWEHAEVMIRRQRGVMGSAGLVLSIVAGCAESAPSEITTRSTAATSATTPADSFSPAAPAIDLGAIVIPPESPPPAMTSSSDSEGPDVLGRLPLSSERAAQLEEQAGFVAGRYSDFSGSGGFLLSWAVQYVSADDATDAVSILLDELQSEDGYGWGSGEDAGLGDEGTCLEGDNPQEGGLHETICVWRNGPLVLVVGGDTGETPMQSFAEAMDARADAAMR